MSIEFWAAGNILGGTATTLAPVAPTLNANDVMIVQIANLDNAVISAPDSTWTLINQLDNGAGFRSTCFWKLAVAASSGAAFTFTGFTNAVGNCGVITAFRGCNPTNPIGTATSSANASADAVTYATLTPLRNDGAVVALGFYGDDATAVGAMTGTTPTMAITVDLEVTSGTGMSLFQHWGKLGMGGAVGAISSPSNSTTDAVNNGILVELFTADLGGSRIGPGSIMYPRLERTRTPF